MSVIAEFVISSDQFVLGRILREYPDLYVEIERVVPAGRRVMPYVWVYGADLSAFETAIRTNSDVKSVTLLDRLEDSALYKIEWEEPVANIITGITATDATILEARGDDEWQFRIRFENHAGLAAFHEYCDEHGIEYRLSRVSTLRETPTGRSTFGLTEAQRETLELAVERGYFKVPRQATYAELAADLGISEQAVSERVRRATDAVLTEVLLDGP